MADFSKLSDIKDKLKKTRDDVVAIVDNPWPQTKINPGFSKTIGFLPPVLISPTLDMIGGDNSAKIKVGSYEYEDWMGHKISPNGLIERETKERFDESVNIPKSNLESSPYSTRDHYKIFDDNRTDYFKHGLHIIDGLTPIENNSGDSDLRLSNFKSTPFENNDPVMFGFEIVIDAISSPLLNGSVLDFLNQYTSVNELAARIPVYEDFKQQFSKFFKTKGTIRVDAEQTTMSKTNNNSGIDNNKELYQLGKGPYMGYYIQKISGLQNLSESNKPGTFKYLSDYRKDLITIDFLEDVSLSVGALSHLYKLLYWSKPNGKGMVPENLLRFNCDIIVSECRNFNRVRKALDSGNLEIIKDNVSRYVYTLTECQFFFDKMPHPDEIDMGSISVFDKNSIIFDYKFSTVKFEKFTPTTNGFGKYVGYDNGSIWKIGNRGARDGNSTDTSQPKFFTVGENKLRQNGVEKPFILNSIGKFKSDEIENTEIKTESENNLESLEKTSKEKAKDYAKKVSNRLIEDSKKNIKNVVNTRTQLLARTLNKAFISTQGGTIPPPKNIYTSGMSEYGALGKSGNNISQRFFYDLRGDLVGFLGNSIGDGFSSGGKKG